MTLSTPVVVGVSLAYLTVLFIVAHLGDRRAGAGRSLIDNGVVYALSLGVYATTWTYYGSVGRAVTSGIGFLPIYLGPTLMAALFWVVLRRIIRICRQQRITSLADFVSSRYGKSTALGQLVTIVAVVGVVPYIALQLKAVSETFAILRGVPADDPAPAVHADTALYVALVLAVFTIIFGTRHLDATERHEGMVTAIAFESLVKLVAFLAVGIWVTFVAFDGFGDLFGRAATDRDLSRMLSFGDQSHAAWTWLIVLSMLALLLLPRQWQVGVVENVDERHLRTAAWLLPAYLLLINIFVMPIAIAGLVTFADGSVDPDAFVIALPREGGQEALALLVFIGGLSAATGMVIVETIALATMVSNSLVLPVLLRRGGRLIEGRDLGRLILLIRRLTIVATLLLGFAYFRMAGDALALVSIGLVSFAAVAQFAPAILGGLFWRGATGRGALWGLAAGFVVWAYTLPLPSLAATGLIPESFVTEGPFSLAALRPHALLNVEGMDEVSHSMMWSMLVNIGLFVGLSLTMRQSPAERLQASAFVDVMERTDPARAWRGTATVGDLRALLVRFLGADAAARALGSAPDSQSAGPELVQHAETVLAGAVGAASARFAVASAVQEEPIAVDEVLDVLDENSRLQELDRLKDDFISSVTHELRTPLTSIRAFSEILLAHRDIDEAERQRYLQIVIDESVRLTRLINQVLDLSKLEAEAVQWQIEAVDPAEVISAAADTIEQMARDSGVTVTVSVPDDTPPMRADADKLRQVVLNLLSNAVKFAPQGSGEVRISVRADRDHVRIDVTDNGPGISQADQAFVFEKFRQVGDLAARRPAGTGLGLPISRQIVEHLGGRLWVRSGVGHGATFSFELPVWRAS